jgi:hypothetical protein
MSVYSFQDCVATITGAGGFINLAKNAGVAEEGITIEAMEDKNVMTIGADGSGMHSLIANEASTVTVRLLKTSPVNQQLSIMYNLQSRTSLTHGKNIITIRDTVRGDYTVLTNVAFKKRPATNYAKEGGLVEWTFDAIKTTQILGSGNPSIL